MQTSRLYTLDAVNIMQCCSGFWEQMFRDSWVLQWVVLDILQNTVQLCAKLSSLVRVVNKTQSEAREVVLLVKSSFLAFVP